MRRAISDSAASHHSRFKCAFLVWILLISVEFVHGSLRAIFLVPVRGDFRPRHTGVFIGSVLILLVTDVFVGSLRAPDSGAHGRAWETITPSGRACCFSLE